MKHPVKSIKIFEIGFCEGKELSYCSTAKIADFGRIKIRFFNFEIVVKKLFFNQISKFKKFSTSKDMRNNVWQKKIFWGHFFIFLRHRYPKRNVTMLT